jgi:hypothetical protein
VTVPDERRMKLLSMRMPDSVTEFFYARGHDVILVESLPAQTQWSIVGDRLSAIVVSGDKDFSNLARRVAHGSRAKFAISGE